MAHEIETKVLGIDLITVQNKLKTLGAKEIRSSRLSVDWFRPVGTPKGEDPWFLRVRSYSDGQKEVTWKAKSDILGTARKHKEINFTVSDHNLVGDLFSELNLEKYAHQDKDRISYKYKNWQIDIDQYPNMPPFLEIEGQDENHINEAIKLFDLTGFETWARGERILIEEIYGLDWYNMRF